MKKMVVIYFIGIFFILLLLLNVKAVDNTICTDSDRGIDIYTGGYVNDSTGPINDSCKNNKTVSETYCKDNKKTIEDIQCPNAYDCKEGICTLESSGCYYKKSCNDLKSIKNAKICNNFEVSKEVVETCKVECFEGVCVNFSEACIDSDGGLNYFEAGKTIGTNRLDGAVDVQDKCENNDKLLEYYCLDNFVLNYTYVCPNGCKDDKCIKLFDSKGCIDPDGGLNYFEASTVSDGTKELKDECFGEFALSEAYCSNESKAVRINPNILCPYGCKDGVCNKQNQENYQKITLNEEFTINLNEENIFEGIFKIKFVSIKTNSDLIINIDMININDTKTTGLNMDLVLTKGNRFYFKGYYITLIELEKNTSTIIIGREKIKESVKCIFKNSNQIKRCYIGKGEVLNEGSASCSGNQSCVVEINGYKGSDLEWKSSCGGYLNSKFDGVDKTIEFNCSDGKFNEKDLAGSGFRYTYYECYDGAKMNLEDLSSCKSSEKWQNYANDFCKDKCKNKKCGVMSFTVSNECYTDENNNENKSGENETNIKLPEDTLICKDSCPLNSKCYQRGYRKNSNFCSDAGKFIGQKGNNKECENSFECQSNVCSSGKCLSQGFLKNTINWFRKLFGN